MDSKFFVNRQSGGIAIIADKSFVQGTLWFVDSTKSAASDTAGFGRSPDSPFATLDFAVGQADASTGDVIFLMPGHAENISAIGAVAIDVAGLTILGLGEGALRPTFTFDTATGADWAITVANTVLENIVFVSDIADLDNFLDVSAAGDGLRIEHCEFRDGGAAKEVKDPITLAAGCTGVVIRKNRFYGTAAANNKSALLLEGAADRLVFEDNVVIGDYETAVITGTVAASALISIQRNIINNLDAAAGLAVSLHASATGAVVDNIVHGGLTSVDPIVAAACLVARNERVTNEGVNVESSLGLKSVRATGNIAQTGVLPLFTVTGRVLVKAIIGEITTVIQTQANATKLSLNPTAGDTVDICSALDITADAVGSTYGISGLAGDALQHGCVCSIPVVVEAGVIELNCAASNTGQVQWTVYWEELEAGSTLVAA